MSPSHACNCYAKNKSATGCKSEIPDGGPVEFLFEAGRLLGMMFVLSKSGLATLVEAVFTKGLLV